MFVADAPCNKCAPLIPANINDLKLFYNKPFYVAHLPNQKAIFNTTTAQKKANNQNRGITQKITHGRTLQRKIQTTSTHQQRICTENQY